MRRPAERDLNSRGGISGVRFLTTTMLTAAATSSAPASARVVIASADDHEIWAESKPTSSSVVEATTTGSSVQSQCARRTEEASEVEGTGPFAQGELLRRLDFEDGQQDRSGNAERRQVHEEGPALPRVRWENRSTRTHPLASIRQSSADQRPE